VVAILVNNNFILQHHRSINLFFKTIKLKKYFLNLFFITLSFCATAQKQFVVDEHAELREINGSFTTIEVSSGIHLYLTKGTVETVAISASEDKYKNNIKTDVEDNVLKIYYSGDGIRWGNNQRLNVYVSYKSIEQITATGASNIIAADEIDAKSLGIKLSGASDFKGKLKVEELSIKLSGASDAKINGTAINLNIECSGASDCKAYELTAENAIVKASGASDISITVNKEITANASGASNVNYKGAASLKGKYSGGASSINKEN
jgi:hypothetical protein